METSIEKKRGRLFRFIAWTVSLVLHVLLLYVLTSGVDQKEAAKSDVAAMTSGIETQNKP